MQTSSSPASRQWLKELLHPLQPVARDVLTSTLFVNVLALGAPIFCMQIYNRVVAQSAMETLKGLAIGMVLVLLFDYVLRQSRARIMQVVSLHLDVRISERVFSKMTRLPLRSLESRPASFWQQLFRDVDLIRNTLAGGSAILAADLPFALLFLGVIFVIGRPLAVVFLLMLALFILLAWWSGRSLSQSSGSEKNAMANRDALLAEIVAGRTTIKGAGLDRALQPLWEDRQAAAIQQSIVRGSTADGFVNLGTVLTAFGSVALTAVGAIYIIDHELSMGALIACNMLSGRLYGPINQLVGAWRTYGAFQQAVDRISSLFAEQEERYDSVIRHQRPTGGLKAEHIRFSYSPTAAPCLDVESLDIQPGGITAILGRNGSGKTTLLKILMGLYAPAQGRVLLDGADIHQYSRREMAEWVGYVPQETVLFNTTIRDNMAYGAPGCTDEDLIRAATQAGVHQVIVDMPEGYGTSIGEAGSRLSAGQRQRIAIARALVSDPPVLMLDEPSASLDRQAEEDLRHTLQELAKTRTVLVVTHSPVLLAACRDVVVLDKGHLLARGPASEILPRLFGRGASAVPAAAAPGTAPLSSPSPSSGPGGPA